MARAGGILSGLCRAGGFTASLTLLWLVHHKHRGEVTDITAKRGGRPATLNSPERVTAQIEGPDVAYIDSVRGDRKRSEIVRLAVGQWVARHKTAAIMAHSNE